MIITINNANVIKKGAVNFWLTLINYEEYKKVEEITLSKSASTSHNIGLCINKWVKKCLAPQVYEI